MQLLAIIRRDVLSKFVGEIFSKFLFLIFFFYVGRKLGTTEFGVLNVAISTTYILGVLFLDPGLNLATIQLLISEEEPNDRTASTVLSFKLLAYPLMVTAMWVLNRAFSERLPPFPILLLASLFILFTAIFEYFCSVTNAYHRMDLEAYLKIFNRVCIIVLGIICLRNGHILGVLWALVVGTFAACVLAFFVLREHIVRIHLSWDNQIIRKALRAGIPIAGTLIVGTIYLKWDLLVLTYFAIGKQQIGWYAGAFKIVEAFSALPSLLGAALFPLIFRLRTENPVALDRLLNATIKAVLLFSIPIAATISLFSRQITAFVYGNSFLPGAGVLAVLIWCIVPIFLYFYLMFVNVAAGQAKTNLWAGCLALAAGLTANVVLVPRLGYIGAAWSALIANSSFAILATWRVCLSFKRATIPPMLLRLFLAASAMLSVVALVRAGLGLQFGLGLLSYLSVLILLGTLKSEDWVLMIRMLQARSQPQI
jgi:O-antigen/teichoic acid export membrane protein